MAAAEILSTGTCHPEVRGLYLWESGEDFLAYRDSEHRATIAKAFQTIGELRIEVIDVLKPLRELYYR